MNPPHPQPPLLTPNCCEGRGRLACGKSQQAAQPHKLRLTPLTDPPALPIRRERRGAEKGGGGGARAGPEATQIK